MSLMDGVVERGITFGRGCHEEVATGSSVFHVTTIHCFDHGIVLSYTFNRTGPEKPDRSRERKPSSSGLSAAYTVWSN
jgi:hypothetical protein